MVETQEMEIQGGAAAGTDDTVETLQEERRPVPSANEGNINNTAARRRRTSLSPRLRRSTSLGSLRQDRDGNGGFSRKKDIGLRLPSFRILGISSADPKYLTRNEHTKNPNLRSEVHLQIQRPGLRPRHTSEQHFGSTPLLTPPEDINSIKWNNARLHTSSQSGSRCIRHSKHYSPMNGITSVSMADSPAAVSTSLPGQQEQAGQRVSMSDLRGQLMNDDAGNNGNWLGQAIEETGMYTQAYSPMASWRD